MISTRCPAARISEKLQAYLEFLKVYELDQMRCDSWHLLNNPDFRDGDLQSFAARNSSLRNSADYREAERFQQDRGAILTFDPELFLDLAAALRLPIRCAGAPRADYRGLALAIAAKFAVHNRVCTFAARKMCLPVS